MMNGESEFSRLLEIGERCNTADADLPHFIQEVRADTEIPPVGELIDGLAKAKEERYQTMMRHRWDYLLNESHAVFSS